MKHLLTLLLAAALLCTFTAAYAQIDTIYTRAEVIPCNVVEVDETSVHYVYPNETHSNTMSLNLVSKIIFKSGRTQQFSTATSFRKLNSPFDWEKVAITGFESEIRGLYKIEDISSKSKGLTELSSQERVKRRAVDKLKIQAALMGANGINSESQWRKKIISLPNEDKKADQSAGVDAAGGCV